MNKEALLKELEELTDIAGDIMMLVEGKQQTSNAPAIDNMSAELVQRLVKLRKEIGKA